MSSARFLVRGQVQGVGFRWFVSRQARRLGIGGYARNLPDGSVEVMARADDPAALSRLEELLRNGPDNAVVDSLDREDRPDDEHVTLRSFDIR
ncbi:MAG: acylphosphatase [Gemmatimonadales bacterium]